MSAFPWKAVAWDIDGTLVDSEPLHYRALLAACGEHGLDLRGLPEATFIGMHLRDVWARLRPRLPETLAEAQFHGRIHHHYAAGAAGIGAIAGAVETIRALDALGVAQVCASNSGRAIVDANLAAIDMTALMRGTVSLDDVVEGKPAPEPYLRAARLIGTDPADILAVEDSLTGVRAARAAGMQVALLSHGADGPPAGMDAAPHFRIAALEEILRLGR